MNPEEIYAAFRRPIDAFPEAAFQEALKRSDEMRPLLIAELKKSMQRSLAGESLDQELGHCYALLLLAHQRCQELFPIIVEWLASTEEDLDDAFGDYWMGSFPDFLLATYSGEIDSLCAILRNSSQGEYQRSVTCDALMQLCVTDPSKRSAVVEVMLEQVKDDGNPEFLLQCLAGDLCSLCPVESESFLRESGLCTEEEISESLTLGISGCLKQYKDLHRIGDCANFLSYFRTWAFVREAKEYPAKPEPKFLKPAPKVQCEPRPKTPAFQPPPPPKPKALVNQDERLISRNGPCPCGSGKIYKKCCAKN